MRTPPSRTLRVSLHFVRLWAAGGRLRRRHLQDGRLCGRRAARVQGEGQGEGPGQAGGQSYRCQREGEGARCGKHPAEGQGVCFVELRRGQGVYGWCCSRYFVVFPSRAGAYHFFPSLCGRVTPVTPAFYGGGGHDFFVIQYGKRESVDFVRVCDRF